METITITLGKYKTNQDYLAAIKKKNSVSAYAEELILKAPLTKKKQPIEVALLTFADLGLTGIQTTESIQKAAEKKGYGMPDAEIALALALENKEIGDWWITLHDSITVSVGGPFVFGADRYDNGQWVYASWAYPDFRWRGLGAFAFPVPASTSSAIAPSALPSESLHLDLEARVAELERVIKHHNL